MKAIEFGQNENAKILLRYGANPDIKNRVNNFFNYLGRFGFTTDCYLS